MFFAIDTANGIAVYEQIVRQVKFAVAREAVKPGEMVPSVRELARELAVNPNTVARTYRQLQTDGVLASVRGTGLEVATAARDRCRRETVELIRAIAAGAQRSAAKSTLGRRSAATGRGGAKDGKPRRDMTMQPAIRLANVSKRFGNQTALDGVSFEVPPGCVFGLLGENGAGKTTAIRILLGLVEPDEGVAEVLSIDSRGRQLDVLRRVGYVPERPTLYEWMTVAEIGWFTAGFYGGDYARHYDQLISDFALPQDRKIKALSKGMRAKVALALALRISRRCCCWTSRLPAWTRWCGESSWRAWSTWQQPAAPCSYPVTRFRKWSAWPISLPFCTRDGWFWSSGSMS